MKAHFALEPKHTWRFYVRLSCGALLMLGAVLFAGLLLYARIVVGKYTSAQPAPISTEDVTEQDRQALIAKWSDFLNLLGSGRASPPLTMSSKEINVFMAMMPRLNQRVHVTVAEGRLRAEFAVPLDSLAGPLPVGLNGRYANGVVVGSVSLNPAGQPRFNVDSVILNGRPVPDWVKDEVLRNPHTQDALGVLRNNSLISQLRSIEVRGDQLVFVPANSM